MQSRPTSPSPAGRIPTGHGVVENTFRIDRDGRVVPVALWQPATAAGGLVLLGHGGSGHKRAGRIVEMAHWFVAEAGLTAVAIDGPYHGERVPKPLTAQDYQARIAAEGATNVVDRVVEDWRATIDAVADLGLTRDPDSPMAVED